MKRRELIEHLEELLSDEFDSSELVYLTKKELIKILINTAKYYKYENELGTTGGGNLPVDNVQRGHGYWRVLCCKGNNCTSIVYRRILFIN